MWPYTSTLSVILNEKGGIIDDTVITKHASDAFYVVTNAGRRESDLAWFKHKIEEWNASDKGKQGPVEMQVLQDWGLVALQGMFLSCVVILSLLSSSVSQDQKRRLTFKVLHLTTCVS
jgi:hypothetical protein